MKKVLVLGAGRTAPSLIDYLANCTSPQMEIRLGDISAQLAEEKAQMYSNVTGFQFDVMNEVQLESEVQHCSLVISLLPIKFHILVAKTCLKYRKHLLTASYVSAEMQDIDAEAQKMGVLFLNECGLDPGIDHMTAMAALDYIREEQGGTIDSFISYTGGLIAPESDNNPWHYKFTWNPRNVVLAGRETAQYIRNGRYKYIPYHRLFTRLTSVHIKGFGDFEAYANRDSLKYRERYGLHDVQTMFRGTLRRPGFCQAWNILVQLGLTDDSYQLEGLDQMTYRDFINTFLYYHPSKSVEDKLCEYMSIDPKGSIMHQLKWLGIFERNRIGLKCSSPAQVLQYVLEQKWRLEPQDRDMIVMQHQVGYQVGNRSGSLISSLVVIGENTEKTAMSKTVGWPLAIATKLILSNKIKDLGVRLPITAQYYQPILSELQKLGVNIIEESA
jgi:saccharopine dehydrogenase (NADP+, L-glutamate forming)